MNKSGKCLVVFSGGQDSTVCLHWALDKFQDVNAIFFDYGQRHIIEWESAQKIATLNNVSIRKFKLNFFEDLGGNSLINKDIAIKHPDNEVPNTFVPGRNLIFLTYAASYGFTLGINNIVTGVCQTDFSGYPDCRQSTMDSLEKTLSQGMDKNFKIHTPLMYLSKAESVILGQTLNAMESLAFSHTCYEGKTPPCGLCPSCLLRAKGFEEAGVMDPLIKRFENLSA